ncbi:MAG: LysR family transcriptional regulator [Burkholderiales bacterium]|nr:LysR family transcriptional regulator [Burkholderiales bacterium]
MTLKQLETFYWVCRLGGFAAAAHHLHSTQSAVSMRIQDLESSLGVTLFDRNQRSARLTAKGQELIPYAERLMAATSEIRHRIGDPKVLSGTVRLGVTEFVAVTWLPKLVGAINEEYPDIALELDVDLTLTQLRKLQSGDLDVAVLPGPIEEPGLANVSLGSVEFAWMASSKLGVPSKRLTPRDLHAWPLLTLTHDSNLHKLLAKWFEASGATMKRTNACNSIGVLAALTIAGLGVSYLPREHFAHEVDDGRLQVLNIAPRLPALEYVAVFEQRQIQPLSQVIAQLAQACSTFRQSPNAKARKH